MQLDGLARLGEQVIEPIVQVEDDEDPHGQKRQQLDQRLERDRQHHAPVVLGDVQAARAEYDGEQRQHQRHHQRSVLYARAGGVCTGADQQIDAQHDAFELQGNVGQHAHQADQCHDHGQRLGFAVTGSDEVGNGSDVLLFADQHHLLHHPRCEDQKQYRPQVDRQECPQLLGRLSDRAEERPAGAIHRQRQAVHPGTQFGRQRGATPVAIEGDGEHDGHIGQGDRGDQPAGQRHGDSEAKWITRPGQPVWHDRWRAVSADDGRSGRWSQRDAPKLRARAGPSRRVED